ncbi:uncharacterized protein METZ01_LOCUS377329, partial [marine metagenome]
SRKNSSLCMWFHSFFLLCICCCQNFILKT